MMTATTDRSDSTAIDSGKFAMFALSTGTVLALFAGFFVQYSQPAFGYIIALFLSWTSGTLYAARHTARVAQNELALGPGILLYGAILFPVLMAALNSDTVARELGRGLLSATLLMAFEALLFAGLGAALSWVLWFWYEQYREYGAGKTIWHSVLILWGAILVLNLILSVARLLGVRRS